MAVIRLLVTLTLLFSAGQLYSAVLPEQKVDLIYHSYEGDNTDVDGPAVLVRKNFAEKVSVWGRYYEDVVSGASIDVRAAATSFVEDRIEFGGGLEYLYGKTKLNAGYTNSDSGDYISDSFSLGISHEFFGDLTSVSLSFGFSDEVVFDVTDTDFEDEVQTESFALAVSQILTKNIVVGLTAQSIASEGFLNSPYRVVRFDDPTQLDGFGIEDELYPRIRNSDAVAIRYNQYLPYRASIRGEYRTFADSWGIRSDNLRFDYIHPISEDLTLHFNARYYEQSSADFYSDLFAFSEATTFRARDKELSSYSTFSFGAGASYKLPESTIPFFKNTSVNFFFDRINYNYDDFRDVTASGFEVGEEPLFGFEALVFRIFVSLRY